jgi:hypothetical protein
VAKGLAYVAAGARGNHAACWWSGAIKPSHTAALNLNQKNLSRRLGIRRLPIESPTRRNRSATYPLSALHAALATKGSRRSSTRATCTADQFPLLVQAVSNGPQTGCAGLLEGLDCRCDIGRPTLGTLLYGALSGCDGCRRRVTTARQTFISANADIAPPRTRQTAGVVPPSQAGQEHGRPGRGRVIEAGRAGRLSEPPRRERVIWDWRIPYRG